MLLSTYPSRSFCYVSVKTASIEPIRFSLLQPDAEGDLTSLSRSLFHVPLAASSASGDSPVPATVVIFTPPTLATGLLL